MYIYICIYVFGIDTYRWAWHFKRIFMRNLEEQIRSCVSRLPANSKCHKSWLHDCYGAHVFSHVSTTSFAFVPSFVKSHLCGRHNVNDIQMTCVCILGAQHGSL